MFVTDRNNHRIRKIDSNGIISTVVGNGTGEFCGDGGPASGGCLNYPSGVCADSSGAINVADTGNNRIRKVSNGVITTIAGNGGNSGPVTGNATSTGFNWPWSVSTYGESVYFSTFFTSRIFKITGGIISVVAGSGTSNSSPWPDSALSANLWNPTAVFVDRTGVVYLNEAANQRIGMVFPNGTIKQIA
jgi:trimeric autotransporter adhesin